MVHSQEPSNHTNSDFSTKWNYNRCLSPHGTRCVELLPPQVLTRSERSCDDGNCVVMTTIKTQSVVWMFLFVMQQTAWRWNCELFHPPGVSALLLPSYPTTARERTSGQYSSRCWDTTTSRRLSRVGIDSDDTILPSVRPVPKDKQFLIHWK